MAKRQAPALDPVTQYATDVTAGRVVASRLVRLACQRHLNDVATGERRGLVWDVERAERVIGFFRDVLILPENTDDDDNPIVDDAGEHDPRPFVLTPFQQFIAGSLFGWYAWRKNKKDVKRLVRRFRVAYIETGKGSGKTPFGAGLMLYLMVADGTKGAQVFCAANTLLQAKEYGFTDAVKMVNASPKLTARVDVKANNLAVLETGSFLRPVSSEKRGLDGKRVHGALIDEEHEHRTDDVYAKIRAGTKGRPNALIVVITNSGFNLETVCYRHHEYSQKVLDGTLENDAWFAFVCHLDSCQKCFEAGRWQPSDDCASCDDWKTEGPHWLKPNPNLGTTIQWDYLREQVQEAVGVPSQRNMVRRLNFCQWTQQATAWIPAEAWQRCKGAVSRASAVKRECYLGIDLSDKIDLSSVVAIFPRPLDGPAIEGQTERPVSWAFDVLPFFWMPEKTQAKRAQEDNIPYPDWVNANHIFTTPGSLIDHDAIVEYIIGTMAPKYTILGIGIDQAGAAGVVSKLRRHFGDEFVDEIPQGFRSLSEPSKTLEALIVSGNISHDGNPCQAMCISNMGKQENTWNEIRPVKMGQRKRIDGGVALIDAIAKLLKSPPPDPSVYLTRGVRSLADYLTDEA